MSIDNWFKTRLLMLMNTCGKNFVLCLPLGNDIWLSITELLHVFLTMCVIQNEILCTPCELVLGQIENSYVNTDWLIH